MIIIVVMVVNPTNTGTGTDKYDPTGPFNIGQCNNHTQTRELLNTYHTNMTNNTSNGGHWATQARTKLGRSFW